jgi:diaminopimelate decarboxylase
VGALRTLGHPVCAYVYDTAGLRRRVAEIRAALPTGAELYYAVKANSHPAVLAALAPVTDGMDIASGGEIRKAVAAGAHRLAFSGPGKTDAELAAAVAAGAMINVESRLELLRLGQRTNPDIGDPVPITLRVNRAGPPPPGTHYMTGAPTAFGIDEELLPQMVTTVRQLPRVRLVGFHLHAVSNNLDAAAHAEFVAAALDWSTAAATRLGIDLEVVNVGGGMGIDYPGGGGLDLSEFVARVPPLPPGIRVLFELGRMIAADAGWYAAEVLDLKRTHGHWYAILRGGTHHFRLPAAWGYSHPFTVLPVQGWPYLFARPEVIDDTITVAGELCTPRDILARDAYVQRLRVGDILVFPRTGAYAWEISHHDFLSHDRPDIIVL